MHRLLGRRPSPATVISLVALFVALGGTGYAAVQLAPRNSIGSTQVINGSLQKIDLSKKAVTALKGNRGAQGPAGAPGPVGASGPSGGVGATGPTGSAAAFAGVEGNGTLFTPATLAKNVTAANISHP